MSRMSYQSVHQCHSQQRADHRAGRNPFFLSPIAARTAYQVRKNQIHGSISSLQSRTKLPAA